LFAAMHAVQNVLENAIKHTPAGAPVHVTCGPGPVITVEDAGPGLTEEDAARVFAAFQRGRTDAGGTGLGLAIVERSMELNRGAVEIGRSRFGGACFRLSFTSAAMEPGHLGKPAAARAGLQEPARAV
jgi:two-component system OmpR family sensor kinase